ncbi:MAG: hypothetical protein A2104_01065 [Candidatus Melainabacteria bacterium GWF2_32_7]|nr:MAG: hypothetical protein A2104_01065 [Candidatus Melainabacteria bacterium GWF2_32_7]
MIINNDLSIIDKIWNVNKIRDISKSSYQDDFSKTKISQNEIVDKATISKEGMELYKQDQANQIKDTEKNKDSNNNDKELSKEDKKKVEDLKIRDKEVRSHEQAHMSAAAGLVVKSAQYEYEQGSDGQRYAVSGEVSLNVSKGKTPEETIEKAQKIKSAAMAPAKPSTQDMKVAQQADRMIREAQAEKNSNQSQDIDEENITKQAYSETDKTIKLQPENEEDFSNQIGESKKSVLKNFSHK